MKFSACFAPKIKIALWIMAALSLAGLIVGILSLAGVPIEISRPQAILLVSICGIAVVVALLLATIYYKVDDHFLRLKIAFVDILGGRICIDKILNVVFMDGKMFISYLWKGPDPVISAIMIKPKHYATLRDALIAKNPKIIFHEEKHEPTDSQQ